MSKLLIKGGLVVTVDPEDQIYRNGSVYICLLYTSPSPRDRS